MTSNTNTLHWNRGAQHQQRPFNQRPGQQRPQQRGSSDHGGFDSLLVGRDCLTELGNGKVIRGVIVTASKYFYLINTNGQIIVVNKAWVVSITPVQSQNKKEVVGTLVGASAGTGGDHDSGKQQSGK
jgi:hypothetical protein